jgi:TM2 domain-containing membrane protein YozV
MKYILLIILFFLAIGTETGFSASISPVNSDYFQKNTTSNPSKNKLSLLKSKLKLFSPSKGKDKTETILALICCAFLGSMGFHRVIMGGDYMLILWYCLTFGGFFMILPVLDFIRILIEPEHYEDNSKFFAAFGAM